ncbi:MAG: CBS domain containing membrane protein [candidate division TA06 bacterium 34_109]|uniref:CBS domain containing membrane protein n=1 Tax=candidate division TA06 bacterium 34_109 TaxID=1635277 RepID=A0A117M5P9_UNCT6|nr:MAG: CBS domain containing membrane protein [candidate division TA06 bacterium 34_109]
MNNHKSLNLEKLTEQLKQIKAKDIMTKEVITVKKEDTLAEVAELMISKRISGFPVVEDNEIIGIITTNDLFLVMDMIKTGEILINNSSEYSQPKVSFAMSTEVITVSPEGNLDEIIALMKYRNIHTLPVTSQNKLVGVIGRRDVFKNFYSVVRDLI